MYRRLSKLVGEDTNAINLRYLYVWCILFFLFLNVILGKLLSGSIGILDDAISLISFDFAVTSLLKFIFLANELYAY